MGVRARTVLLLLVTASALWAVLQGAGIILGDRVSIQIDERTAATSVDRAASEIDHNAQQLTLIAADWALWDDAYRFMKVRDPAFARTNLTDATLSSLDVDFMIFADKTGRIVSSKAIDPVSRHDIPLPTGLNRYLASTVARLRLTNPRVARTGAASLPAGPLLVAVQPISTSDGSAPPDGLLVTGYFLSPNRLDALRKLTLLPLVLRAAGSDSPSKTTVVAASSTVTGYKVVKGPDGRPALVVSVAQPRAAFALTRTAVLEGGAALAVFGLILVVGLGLTLDTIVLPDHLRALQSQAILDVAREAMDRLDEGLSPDEAGAVCRLVLEHSTADAVVLTDTTHVLGYAGLGDDHHASGGPIIMTATREALRTNTRRVLRTQAEIGCPAPRCPLKAAILVPLQIAGQASGMLEFFFTSPRKLNRTSIALADGLAPLLSMQLELDRSHRELAHLAAHDPLTGLANRRQFETELKRELSEQKRLGGAGRCSGSTSTTSRMSTTASVMRPATSCSSLWLGCSRRPHASTRPLRGSAETSSGCSCRTSRRLRRGLLPPDCST
jgi:sensor domain CHASE-containing protein